MGICRYNLILLLGQIDKAAQYTLKQQSESDIQ